MNNIQVGKFYKTRDESKIRIYALDGVFPFSIHGAYETIGEQWNSTNWLGDGGYLLDNDKSHLDIVSEWIDKPVFDWSIQSPWFKYAAMDEDGKWFLYEDRPMCRSIAWVSIPTLSKVCAVSAIPTAYAPTFNGDWKDSLIQRP